MAGQQPVEATSVESAPAILVVDDNRVKRLALRAMLTPLGHRAAAELMCERRILVIDDSRVIRQVTEMVLGQYGWEVLSAESGREGVALAARDRPDAILLDVIMPDPDGLATLVELRKRPETSHIPVVFLTAQADNVRESRKLSTLGVSGLIAKPFAPRELARTVGALLGWST